MTDRGKPTPRDAITPHEPDATALPKLITALTPTEFGAPRMIGYGRSRVDGLGYVFTLSANIRNPNYDINNPNSGRESMAVQTNISDAELLEGLKWFERETQRLTNTPAEEVVGYADEQGWASRQLARFDDSVPSGDILRMARLIVGIQEIKTSLDMAFDR